MAEEMHETLASACAVRCGAVRCGATALQGNPIALFATATVFGSGSANALLLLGQEWQPHVRCQQCAIRLHLAQS